MDEFNKNPNSDPHPELLSVASGASTAVEKAHPHSKDLEAGPEAVLPVAGSSDQVPPSKTTETVQSSSSWVERYWKLAVVAILLLAVLLRMRGLNWDDAQHLHPDERFLTMVESAIKLPDSLSQYFDTPASPLNPYNNNFGSFVYGTAPLFLVRVIGQVLGQTDYSKIYLLGRLLSALADLFVLFMTFAIGRRLYGLRVGLLAALLYAIAVFPIQQSHFFTVDTFTNVPLMLAFWFTLDIAEGKPGWKPFVLAGVSYGFMLACRINMAPYLGIIGIAALLRLIKQLGEIPHVSVHLDRDIAAAVEVSQTGEGSRLRTYRLGPILIEVEYKSGAPAGMSPAVGEPQRTESILNFRKNVWPILVGLVLTVAAAMLIFRVAQPYAFDGTFSLNPQFVEDMTKTQRLVSGQDDYPPGHQWAYRTPYWFSWYNIVFWGLGPALGFAAWLGVALAAWQLVRRRSWEHILPLFWVLGMFLYQGQQFVMTMRYMLPLYPFLVTFAAFFLFAVWEGAKALVQNPPRERLVRFVPGARVLAGAVFGIVILASLFWAFAFASIYTRTNTRVAASRWIYANVTNSDVLGVEHWDDSLPLRVDNQDYYRDHQGVNLELYGEDTPEKREQMIGWMDQVTYIILSSNRLYGSIPRLPMRYPLTTQYYKWLFDGQLGFEKVAEFTSYPQLFNIVIPDDRSEEAFSVYDHPKVTIFRKTSAYSHDNIVRLFNSVDLTEVLRLKPLDATTSRHQFKLTPTDLAADRAGGTWAQIIHPGDLANQFPLPVWLGMVWLIGALAFPFTFVTFRRFADRGYAFAKALGILFTAWFAWTLSSYHLLPFSRLPILIGLLVLCGYGFGIVWSHREEMAAYLLASFKLILIEEVVFFAFYALDLFIRYQNPDLWHPNFGGEKPMDLTFLNAILKSTYFPPYNPWFTGNYINYYYFGQLISGVLVRLSGITPEIAYNLLIPLFFALTASGAFGVVFNLVLSAREGTNSESEAENPASRSLWWPSLAGIFGIVLVLIIGNLGEFKLAYKGLQDLGGGTGLSAFFHGLNSWLINKQEIPVRLGDWYWTATRAIPNTINEFPFFTFLYGDLHAHLIALPYTLVALGLATHILFNRRRLQWLDIGLIALVLGALRAINTWDYPTYLGVTGAAMAFLFTGEWTTRNDAEIFDWREWFQQWLHAIVLILFQVIVLVVPLMLLYIRLNLEAILYVIVIFFGMILRLSQSGKSWNPYKLVRDLGWQFIVIILLSVVLFFPYLLNYATGYTQIELWKDVRTTFNEYLTVHGIFLFLAATFLVVTFLRNYRKAESQAVIGFELTGWAVFLVPALVVVEILLLAKKLPIVALVFPLICAGIWLALNRKTKLEARWIALLIVISLLLTLLVEFIVLKGDVGRMNTVFKFYLQAWVMFGVAGAAGLGLIIDQLAPSWPFKRPSSAAVVPASPRFGFLSYLTPSRLRWAWWGIFTALILAGLLYPFAAGRAKMKDRYVPDSPPGLNGMDYMLSATYFENNQEVVLRSDYDAIQWIRANIKGSPVMMEANTGLYRWGNRYTIYTGLPTLIGWDWHTKQQYSLIPGDIVDYRVALVQEFYNTMDQARALEIAHHYGISYVIVGGLERAVYDPNGLSKFQAMAQAGNLTKVYDANGVQIYQVPSNQ